MPKNYKPSERNIKIATIVGCSPKNQKAIAKIVNQAKTDLGIDATELQIIDWLSKKYSSQKNDVNIPQETETINEVNINQNDNSLIDINIPQKEIQDLLMLQEINLSQDTKIENDVNIHQRKNQDGNVFVEENIRQLSNDESTYQDTAALVTVNYGKGDNRRTVQIESFFFYALLQIGVNDISQWMLDNIGTPIKQQKDDKARTGTAKKVKHEIIKALLAKIPK